MYDNGLVPLGVVAYEIGSSLKDLLGRTNGAVTRGAYGERCIPGELFAQMIQERDAELARKHQAEHKALAERKARQAEQQAETEAAQRRRKALREKNRALAESGMPATAVVMADSQQERWDRASLDREDMLPRKGR